MDRLEELLLSWNALVIFRGLNSDGVLSRLAALLSAKEESAARRVDAYAAFAEALFAHTCSLTEYVKRRVLEDDNFYIRRCAQGLPIEPELEACLKAELHTLGELAALDSDTVRKAWIRRVSARLADGAGDLGRYRAHLSGLNTGL